jgi:hypothetical protein
MMAKELDDPLAGWPAMLAENLTGRRVLERVPRLVDSEPATLAQVPASKRVGELIARLHARHHPHAASVEQMASAVVGVLVAELANRSALSVATWEEGQRALVALADLLERLDEATSCASL